MKFTLCLSCDLGLGHVVTSCMSCDLGVKFTLCTSCDLGCVVTL